MSSAVLGFAVLVAVLAGLAVAGLPPAAGPRADPGLYLVIEETAAYACPYAS